MDSSQPNASVKTKKTSTYDPNFEQNLIQHGIYPEGYRGDGIQQEPRNRKEIIARLALPRASPSPSSFTDEAFQDFKAMSQAARNESEVMDIILPILTGSPLISRHRNLLFENFKALTDGTLCKAQPDLNDGCKPSDQNEQIREQLGLYIVPSKNKSALFLPNFFLEGKGPMGSPAVGSNQVLYNGALGARAMHKLRSYVDPQTAFDNNAYTIMATYQRGFLTLYTAHPTQSNNSRKPIEYHMSRLKSFGMFDDLDAFQQGVWAFWNARDLMKEQREELLAAAIRKAGDPELDSSTHSFVSQ